ncbi:Chaoptin [Amphibalanus amphitrite]|uniref:Chaoptin n=1 Tax=Amphibalanus amphitrite TaxID=1232801 RepID=A0A6A4XCI5_AMPAM|nr:Chaoptin [Amphibalanus amphitrite]
MSLSVVLVTALVTVVLVGPAAGLDRPMQRPCDFNPMCSCAVLAGAGAAHTQQVRCVGVPFGVLPDLPLGPLASIELINSGLERLDEDSFRGTRVETLRLMSNHITWIHPAALRSVAGSLISIDVSFNRLYSLPSEMFRAMSNVSFVNLRGNFLSELRPSDWRRMRHSLTQAFVGENELCKLEPGTFAGFRQLTTLNLDGNLLKELPADALPDTLHMLNVNNNLLTRLPTAALHRLRRLNWLYFQGNHITELPATSLGGARRLVELRLSHNLLTELPGRLFNGSTRVHDLHLQYNQLSALRRSAFAGLHLARLFLGYNRLTWVDADAFHGVGHSLTFLDLEGNQLMEVPPALRTLRKLRFLTLANNGLSEVPAGALIPFQDSLESLSLADNLLENVPAAALRGCSQLTSLNLDGNPWTKSRWRASGAVQILDLSRNSIAQLPETLLRRLTALRHLTLAHNQLETLPQPLLQNAPLESLDLSGNRLRVLPSAALAAVGSSLARLDLSDNRLDQLGRHHVRPFQFGSFGMMRSLRVLDLSNNAFAEASSFAGLDHLRDLGLGGLHQLIRFDTDTLLGMRELDTLRITTCPQIEKYRFRLGGVLNGLQSVRRLHVEVRESKLDDQLWGGFGPKLTELRLTGASLRQVDPEAFKGFQGHHELVLQLTDTSVSELPDDLLRHLRHVTALTLDLRRNRLINLSPSTLYRNGSDWETPGTQLVKGGIALSHNRWVCDCGLLWLGQWQRRWVRESLRIHTEVPRNAQHVQRLVRQATCTDLRTGAETPIMDLRAENLHCRIGATDAGGQPVGTGSLLLLPLLLSLPQLLRRDLLDVT